MPFIELDGKSVSTSEVRSFDLTEEEIEIETKEPINPKIPEGYGKRIVRIPVKQKVLEVVTDQRTYRLLGAEAERAYAILSKS